jgi:Arc/MetJ family transcription regulator
MHIVCMKRMNVMVDEELLERARRHLGEKTYSGTINRALDKLTRQERFWKAFLIQSSSRRR